MTLGGVGHELVVLQQLVHRSQLGAAIHVDHDHVEARNGGFFRAVALHECVVGPVHCITVVVHHSQVFQLAERHSHRVILVGKGSAVAQAQFFQIGFLERFALEELNVVHVGFLDDDVVAVAPGCCQRHQFIACSCPALVERQGFMQISVSDFVAYVRNELGQLHIGLLTVQDRTKGYA